MLHVLAAAMLLSPALSAGDEAAFDRWVQPGSVEALEILLAAPSSRHPASLWGHVLLRVRYRDDVPSPPGFAPVFQIGVEDAPDGEELAHTIRGVGGGLDAKLFVTPSHRVERRYRSVESRGLKVFELELDADERRRVLRRLWEASRDGESWGYAFFTDNCAGLLVEELLGPSLAPQLEMSRPRFIRWPSSMVDVLARARRADGRPLVRYLGEEPGVEDRAKDAADARAAVAARLRDAGAPVDATSGDSAAARARGYATLGAWAAESPADATDVAAFLSESLDVELGDARRRSNRASRSELIAVLGDALAPLPPPPPRPPVLRRSTFATGASGGYSARIAAGVQRDSRPFAEVDLAILDEALGDVRERGFRPDLGMRLLGGRVRIEDGGRVPVHEWTFAALDSVRAGHGVSLALRGFGDERRAITTSGFAEFGRAAGVATENGALAVRAAVAGGAAGVDGAGAAPAAGAHARLSARRRTGDTSLDRVEAVLDGEALAIDGRRGWIGRGEIAIAGAAGPRDRPSVVRLAIRVTAGPGLATRDSQEAMMLLEWQLP